MAIMEILSKDSSWKIVVTASSFGFLVYSSLRATIKVYKKVPPNFWDRLAGKSFSWSETQTDFVSVSGGIGTAKLPGVWMPIPGSPKTVQSSSMAEVVAWSVGVGVEITPPLGLGDRPKMIADIVQASGSATMRGETVSAGPVQGS